jgi:hypothetical protein
MKNPGKENTKLIYNYPTSVGVCKVQDEHPLCEKEKGNLLNCLKDSDKRASAEDVAKHWQENKSEDFVQE